MAMKLPGDTLRRPTRPENGALMTCLERRTRCSSTAARAVSNVAAASSMAFSVTLPVRESFLARSLLASARSKRALASATSAAARESSSLTRMSPALTVPPSVKLISSTRPAISEAICTDSSERRLPMARMSVVVVAPRAIAASTAIAPPEPLPLRPFSGTTLPGSTFSAVEICACSRGPDRVASHTTTAKAARTATVVATVLRRMGFPRSFSPPACAIGWRRPVS